MNWTKKLRFQQQNWLGTTSLEKNNLAVAAAHYHLVSGHSFYCLYAFSAGIHVERKDFVLYLEAYEVAASCASKKKIFSVLAVSQTGVLPD